MVPTAFLFLNLSGIDYHSNFRLAFSTCAMAKWIVRPAAGSSAMIPSEKPASVPSQRLLIFDRLPQHDFRLLVRQSARNRQGLRKLALHSRRTDFKRVAVARNHIFHVQNSSYLLRNQLAIGMGNTFRLIDKDPQQASFTSAKQLDIDDFDSLRAAHAFRHFRDFGYNFLPFKVWHALIAIKKWAFAHCFTPTTLVYTQAVEYRYLAQWPEKG